MVQIPKGLDPQEVNGVSGETSKRGLYVFEPKDEFDNKVGDPKFLEANDPAQADAFIHLGWRAASKEEVEQYLKEVESARKTAREDLEKADEIPDTLSQIRESTQAASADVDKDSKRAVAGLTAEKKETK